MYKFKHIPLLHEMIELKYVSKHKHPIYDIYLYDYTRSCMFDGVWNDVTLTCRGLILDADYNIIAYPLRKFFNLSELPPHKQMDLSNKKFKVFDKLDGSCGIIYKYNNVYAVATRGSFSSDQAIFATKILNERYIDIIKKFNHDEYTIICEIIYPENKIVVDYGDFSDLIIIACINKYNGEDLWITDMVISFLESGGLKVNKEIIDYNVHSFEALRHFDLKNKEGFVIHTEDGARVKLKFDRYLLLHKLISTLSTNSIFELLSKNGDLEAFLKNVPDEYDEFVKSEIAKIKNYYKQYDYEVCVAYNEIKNIATQSLENQKYFYEFVCSMMTNRKWLISAILLKHKNRDYSKIIWKLVEKHLKVNNCA
jgi:RNA ligase